MTPLFRLSVRDARFYHPMFRLNRRGKWLPTISVALAMDWFKCDWEVAADYEHLVNLRPSRSVHCHILLPFGCPCTYLTTAEASRLRVGSQNGMGANFARRGTSGPEAQLRSQRAARSLRVSTRGTASGAFVRSSKSGDGLPSPSTHQPNIFDARRAKTPSDGGAGAFGGSAPTAERS